jgi:hypothetical protein
VICIQTALAVLSSLCKKCKKKQEQKCLKKWQVDGACPLVFIATVGSAAGCDGLSFSGAHASHFSGFDLADPCSSTLWLASNPFAFSCRGLFRARGGARERVHFGVLCRLVRADVVASLFLFFFFFFFLFLLLLFFFLLAGAGGVQRVGGVERGAQRAERVGGARGAGAVGERGAAAARLGRRAPRPRPARPPRLLAGAPRAPPPRLLLRCRGGALLLSSFCCFLSSHLLFFSRLLFFFRSSSLISCFLLSFFFSSLFSSSLLSSHLFSSSFPVFSRLLFLVFSHVLIVSSLFFSSSLPSSQVCVVQGDAQAVLARGALSLLSSSGGPAELPLRDARGALLSCRLLLSWRRAPAPAPPRSAPPRPDPVLRALGRAAAAPPPPPVPARPKK